MIYNEHYIKQKQEMVKRYLTKGKTWIVQHIKDCYDEETAKLILKDLDF